MYEERHMYVRLIFKRKLKINETLGCEDEIKLTLETSWFFLTELLKDEPPDSTLLKRRCC